MPIFISSLFFNMAFYGVYAFILEETHRALGVSTGKAGLLVMAYGLGFALAMCLGRVVDRFGARRLLPIILTCIGIAYLSMLMATTSFYTMLSIVLLWGGLMHMGLNMIVLVLVGLRSEVRGSLLGFNSATTYVGLMLGTAGACWLYPIAGFDILAVSAATLMFISAVLSAVKIGCQRSRQ